MSWTLADQRPLAQGPQPRASMPQRAEHGDVGSFADLSQTPKRRSVLAAQHRGHATNPASPIAGAKSHAEVASLQHVLQPRSVAVIGASRRVGSVSRAVLHNVVTGGFSGRIYAVNPRARHLEGVTCVPSVADLPEPVDLGVVVVPAAAVRDVADACGRRGVRALVVISAGLDTGAGADLLAICRRHGMRLIGPNCFGIVVPHIGLNTTFAAVQPKPGHAGLVVQSGGASAALLHQLSRLGIGVSSFASVGNKYDVSSNDLLTWWERDGLTRLAVLYMESFGSPRKFARIARRTAAQMPVLTLQARRTRAGLGVAATRTAAGAAPPISREELYGQAGVIVTSSLGELLEAAALFASQPLPRGDRVAVVSNVDGAGVLVADACMASGLRQAALAGQTQRRLRHLLPSGAMVAGPVETVSSVTQEVLRSCLEEVAADERVDMVLVIIVPTATAPLIPAITMAKVSKPLAAAVLTQSEAVRLLHRDSGRSAATAAFGQVVPSYAYPESAIRALGHAAQYHAWRTRQSGTVPELRDLRAGEARALVRRFLAHHRRGGWLPTPEAVELLSCYGVPLATTRPVTSEDAAVHVAAALGGPVALKADARHRPGRGGANLAHLHLRTEQDIRRAYRTLAATFGAGPHQVFVQPMISGGIEVLIGVVNEPVLGPVVVFGPQGAAGDVRGTCAVRLVPLTDIEAEEMVRGSGTALLSGHGGAPAADLAALREALLRVSRLADDVPEVAAIELDPVIARADGVSAVAARVRITPVEPPDPYLRRIGDP